MESFALSRFMSCLLRNCPMFWMRSLSALTIASAHTMRCLPRYVRTVNRFTLLQKRGRVDGVGQPKGGARGCEHNPVSGLVPGGALYRAFYRGAPRARRLPATAAVRQ